MLTRNLWISAVFLFGSLCLVTAGCRFIDSTVGGGEAVLTIENRAVRAFAPTVFDLALLPLIDPRPWLTDEEFEQWKVEPDSSVELDEAGGGYEIGDDLGLILYTRCECLPGPISAGRECREDATYAKLVSVQAEELRKRNYRVIVNDAPAMECRSGD